MIWRRKIIKAIKRIIAFSGGFILIQVYYYYLLKQIPFPYCLGLILSIAFGLILSLNNEISTQLRCISVLILPMYCGKPGRGVLKAIILTYIVTGKCIGSVGPITNMGFNAREVVRVYACSTQLASNLSREKYDLMLGPAKAAALGITSDVRLLKDSFRSINGVIEQIQLEVEDASEMERIGFENDLIDDMLGHVRRSEDIERKFQMDIKDNTSSTLYFTSLYKKKLRHRCENHISRAVAVCAQKFTIAYHDCAAMLPNHAEYDICLPLIQREVCDLVTELGWNTSAQQLCETPIGPGFGQGYAALKDLKTEFVDKLSDVHLRYRDGYDKNLSDVQDAKETAKRVQQAFEEKTILMHQFLIVINICVALLFVKILNAAINYHHLYLTSIDYDNVYITGYFKRLDARRNFSRRYCVITLLPLKKMERNKYIDISAWHTVSHRRNLMIQILKVALEVVTATTFVMLDRLFYEALEMVRQHAELGICQQGTRDFQIEVEGAGILATMLRKFLSEVHAPDSSRVVTNLACVPHPRQMPYIYFLKIYGGYTWIIFLLFANPYTIRLKRLICSYFYPRREKQRILHLYNDILKKRMKKDETLRRKAVQAIRAHYLSGDILSLLSLRVRFPQLLGWLRVLPAARNTCLICGATEPRIMRYGSSSRSNWYRCEFEQCPFGYCGECWREAGNRCLACDPTLADPSDVDSLSSHLPNICLN